MSRTVVSLLIIAVCAAPVVLDTPDIWCRAQTPERSAPNVEAAERIDKVPIRIELKLAKKKPSRVSDQGILHLTLHADKTYEDLLLQIGFGGAILADSVRGLGKIVPFEASVAGLKGNSSFQTKIPVLRADEPRTYPLRFIVAERGRGYVLASIRPSSTNARFAFEEETALLFMLSTEHGVFFSPHSLLDLAIQEFKTRPRLKSEPREFFDNRIEQMRRSGAKVKIRKGMPSRDPSRESSDKSGSLENSATVHGKIAFTDLEDQTHPVRFARVEIWDQERGAPNVLVATTTTNADGIYSVTFNNDDGDGTGLDIYVVVGAEGEVVRVVDYSQGTVWKISSDPPLSNLPSGSNVEINITATNDESSLNYVNNVAFEVYEAINYSARFLTMLKEPLPEIVTVSFPRPDSDGSYYRPSARTIVLAGTDAHDWDNIHHEYGHHIQHLYKIAKNPGGQHSIGENLCERLGKDAGTRMAWAEGWPTFFGTMLQHEVPGLAQRGIPTVGDTLYTDTKPTRRRFEYDLEASDLHGKGEGNELAVQRVLWDFYDNADDSGDTGVALRPETLWKLTKDSKALSFSAFWEAILSSLSDQIMVDLGTVCAESTGERKARVERALSSQLSQCLHTTGYTLLRNVRGKYIETRSIVTRETDEHRRKNGSNTKNTC